MNTARQPRGAVKLNGTLVPYVEFEVENNAYRAADTFRVSLATDALAPAVGPAFLANATSLAVELFANSAPPDPSRYAPAPADMLILGQADHVEHDLVERMVTITGRDLTARLIDTKTSENHQNATSSQVATILANRRGLTPVVTATSTRIGQFYGADHTDINQEESEWDLLTKLANFEGFDVFVVGRELHFQPKPTDTGARYPIAWTEPDGSSGYPHAPVAALSFSRDMVIAKGVTVEVRSWNAKQKKAFTASWPRVTKGARPGQAAGTATVYHYSIAGLTQDQAYDRAQRLYAQIVAHLVKLDAEMPADDALTCQDIVRVTGTPWDGDFYLDAVRRSMGPQGYTMTLAAKSVPDADGGDA